MIDWERWQVNPTLTGDRDSPEYRLTVRTWKARLLADRLWKALGEVPSPVDDDAPWPEERQFSRVLRAWLRARSIMQHHERALVERMFVARTGEAG